MLESESPVQQDTDGDGEPDRTLDDTERANQPNLARALLKANCPGGDAPAGTKPDGLPGAADATALGTAAGTRRRRGVGLVAVAREPRAGERRGGDGGCRQV